MSQSNLSCHVRRDRFVHARALTGERAQLAGCSRGLTDGVVAVTRARTQTKAIVFIEKQEEINLNLICNERGTDREWRELNELGEDEGTNVTI